MTEKTTKICDLCESKVCHIACPICEKDMCADCEIVANFNSEDKTLFHLIICQNCYYATQVIDFDKDLTEELVKQFAKSMQNIMTLAYLNDDALPEKVKRKKEYKETRASLINAGRAFAPVRFQGINRSLDPNKLRELDKKYKHWITMSPNKVHTYERKRMFGFGTPSTKITSATMLSKQPQSPSAAIVQRRKKI